MYTGGVGREPYPALFEGGDITIVPPDTSSVSTLRPPVKGSGTDSLKKKVLNDSLFPPTYMVAEAMVPTLVERDRKKVLNLLPIPPTNR